MEILYRIVFSTPYSPQYRDIVKVVQKYIQILYSDETMTQILTSPIKCVPRRAFSVGNLVSPSALLAEKLEKPWLYTAGFFKCGHQKCRACGFAMVSKTFRSMSTTNSRIYDVMGYINCNSTYIVYMILCAECNLQYIGCTSNVLKDRIRRHLMDITNPNSGNVSAA